MDLCGPMRVQSPGGARYMFFIVDDYSRFTWVIFLRSKDEVFTQFSQMVPLLEKSLSNSLQAIRSDHGTEFENKEMLCFCREKGISHNFSPPRTLQQNGVVERKNRTLMDAARTMMVEFKSASHVMHLINIACHASNRLYLRKGLNKTPYEILTGNKPNLKYFRVFGCKCFILKKGVHLSKFEPRAQEGIFVGYATNYHAYRILNKSNGILRRRVTWSLMKIMAPKWSKVVFVM